MFLYLWFKDINLRNVANAFPLSNDSRASAIHISIFFSGQITWMAKAELAITQLFWASVALFPNTASKIRAASSGVSPPSRAFIMAHMEQQLLY